MRKTKLLLTFIVMVIIGSLPQTIWAEEQTTIAEWAFDSNSTVPDDQKIQAATGNGTISFYSSDASAAVAPDGTAYGTIKFTSPVNKDMTEASCLEAANHDNYIQVEFSTQGLAAPMFTLNIAQDPDAVLFVVTSVDDGTTWSLAKKTTQTMAWHQAEQFDIELAQTANSEKVIVRLLKGASVSNDARLKGISIKAGEYVAEPEPPTPSSNEMIATWPFAEGTAGQTATLNDESLFALNSVTLGSNLSFVGARTDGGLTFTRIEPASKASSADDNNVLSFNITPQKGVTFTPTKVTLDGYRYGTNGGTINIVLKTADGQSATLLTGGQFNRQGTDPAPSSFEFPVSGISTDKEVSLNIYVYSLDKGKQVGVKDVVISGTYEGTPEEVTTYTFATASSPEEGGTIAQNPVGDTFNEGTPITLTATENFGYDFVNWTDANGNEVSTEPAFVYTVNANSVLTANFKAVTTYALNLSIVGGANDYMVTLSPAPNIVDGNMMYEEGTNVMLSAASNPILTFTHWNSSETSSELPIKMTEDISITANYDAVDYIVGWDFYNAGKEGRPADFASEDNAASSLILRNAAGSVVGWLDKSQMAAGGYEGRPAAVNWQPLTDKYYYQTSFNASAFTDIKVSSSMLYNYNAYKEQQVEYSLNGTDWTPVGTIDLGDAAKVWTTKEFSLPAETNNQELVYVRWIPNYESSVVGTSASNDGTAISDIYITGTLAYVHDPVAPALVSQVPAEGADNASIAGKIVLTFDKKVKITEGATATIGEKTVTLSATGKTVTAEYSALEYSKGYTFTLPAGAVANLSDVATTEAITINFTTKTRPVVEKGQYDFVVPTDGTFEEAIAAAAARTDKNVRFRIFVKKGSYLLAGDKGATVVGSDNVTYPKPTTSLNTPNISIIGEDRDSTILYNEAFAAIEGLGKCQLLAFGSSMTNTYMQDITLKNGMPYLDGRAAALEDAGDKNIFKNVTLFGGQDTYLSNNENGRFYFEGGTLQGYTDFLCGKGDVFYNDVDLIIRRSGSVITAPSRPKQYGYVFVDCTVKAEKDEYDTGYALGRPWGSGTPRAIFINTTMIALPSAAGWTEMSGGYPALFAEYNSMTENGTAINLNDRKTTFGDGYANNPILTAAEAAEYTVENVMGGGDDWDPTYYTEQATVPTLTANENVLSWEESDYVFCYAICKNGQVIDFTTENSYTLVSPQKGDSYTVRAANEMGGLSEASNAYVVSDASGIENVNKTASPVSVEIYTSTGVRVAAPVQGVTIKRTLMDDGSIVITKEITE